MNSVQALDVRMKFDSRTGVSDLINTGTPLRPRMPAPSAAGALAMLIKRRVRMVSELINTDTVDDRESRPLRASPPAVRLAVGRLAVETAMPRRGRRRRTVRHPRGFAYGPGAR